ncbi:MAG: hypothetical protein FWC92_03660 [Defluviitaleaceae bacterium]|nr:hypothetical protein [Defluviitaleaceae bacterium]
MESKVIMYDASGTEVGETYSRRARQLVKQQRAGWVDDSHTAIRFAPDTVEEWEPDASPTPHPAAHGGTTRMHTTDRSSSLYAMAEARVRERNRLVWHSVLLIPVLFIVFLWGLMSYNGTRGGELYLIAMGFAWGAWIMSYVSRLRSFIKMSGYMPGNWDARRKMALDVEVDRLKRMGYTE